MDGKTDYAGSSQRDEKPKLEERRLVVYWIDGKNFRIYNFDSTGKKQFKFFPIEDDLPKTLKSKEDMLLKGWKKEKKSVIKLMGSVVDDTEAHGEILDDIFRKYTELMKTYTGG